MNELIISCIVLSLLHALLPNHWLAVLAISKKQGWSFNRTVSITALSAFAHSLSTIIIGIALTFLGKWLGHQNIHFFEYIGPGLLVGMGIFFIWQHYKHNHFHLHREVETDHKSIIQITYLLVLAMFLSPCLEIGTFFLVAGEYGWAFIGLISLIYLVISLLGMTIFVALGYKGLERTNWHPLEHQAGIIAGIVLIATGLFILLFH